MRSVALGATVMLCAAAAPAATVYDVANHPDGNTVLNGDVDGTGYVLRLDMGLQKHTFNANMIGDLTLSVDAASNQLILAGHVTHNQSGTNTLAADADDDVYLLHAVFGSPSLTDATPSELWFGANADDAVYDDMLDDLLADASPFVDEQTSALYGADKTRVSFFMVELSLTPDAANQHLGETFPQDRLVWDEFPNDATKPLLIEYDWRMAGANALAAAGWIETDPEGVRYGSSDLLFVIGPATETELPPVSEIPLPEALPLGLLGVVMITVARRRFGF